MRDSLGREVDYLRLSVTEACNLRCTYCRGEKGFPRSSPLPSPERCAEIVEAAAALGISKVRITGGEPCLRADLPRIVRGVAAVDGIGEICLTTNGTRIACMAGDLRAEGLSRLNISIDSLDAERYRTITRGGSLYDALAGLAAIRAAGFERTKVNCVLIPGVNDDEAGAFEAFAAEWDVEVRFIELMPIGPAISLIEGARIPGTCVIPTIAPISRPFCSTCNRIRVTADECAKPCLHSAREVSLKGLSGSALVEALRAAILAKPAGHRLREGASDSQRTMSRIGG